jgi:hypothetical protein
MATALASPIKSRLARIQTELGVRADGVLGPETLTALEKILEIAPPVRATSLECSIGSLAEIVTFEVSSKAVYEKDLRRPTWPGGQSGATIGIGYDLGMTARKQIQADWDDHLAEADLSRLLVAQGITGLPAKTLVKSLSDVSISFEIAEAVFYQSTLPRFAALTRATYPGVERLPPDAQGMLLSLIYNRGAKLTGDSRREMAEIQRLVQGGAANLDAIAQELESMVRLWEELPGLQKRRRREARLIRNAARTYSPDELVHL